MAGKRERVVTAVFRDRNRLRHALEDLERSGIGAAQVSVDVQPPEPASISPGNAETARAQSMIGFTRLGIGIGVLCGVVLALIVFGWHNVFAPTSIALVLGCIALGWLSGQWLGRHRQLGFRARETAEGTPESLLVKVHVKDRGDFAAKILRRHGGLGHGGPLI
jgi:hypothetical protein